MRGGRERQRVANPNSAQWAGAFCLRCGFKKGLRTTDERARGTLSLSLSSEGVSGNTRLQNHPDDVTCVRRLYGHTVTSPASISGSGGSSALFASDGTSGCGVNACGGVRISSTARPMSSTGAACSDRGGVQA
eukprot:scaffold15755_cov51-Phaeocystis_antarctica.AAC.1